MQCNIATFARGCAIWGALQSGRLSGFFVPSVMFHLGRYYCLPGGECQGCVKLPQKSDIEGEEELWRTERLCLLRGCMFSEHWDEVAACNGQV
jgi:hypothetical protein